MQFSAEAGVMPDGGDGGGEAAAAWDGGGYSIGRLATPFTGIDNLAVVKERLETHLDMTISKWKGKWPLAERVWVKRQVEKLVFSMNQFLEDEIDDVTATTIRTTVEEMAALLGQVHVATLGRTAGADDEVTALSCFIEKNYAARDVPQPEGSLAGLYERCWTAYEANGPGLEAVRFLPGFPAKADFVQQPILPLFEAVQEMVAATLAHDAALVRNLVRATLVLDSVADFVPALMALDESPTVAIREVRDGFATPIGGSRHVTVWYALADDPSGLLCELQLVLRSVHAMQSKPGDHAQFAALQRLLACLELKEQQAANANGAGGEAPDAFIDDFVDMLRERQGKARADGDLLECAEIDAVIKHTNGIQVELAEARIAMLAHAKVGDVEAAAAARKRMVALHMRFRGIDDDLISARAKPAAMGPDGQRSPHPGYPDLPLDYLRDWKYNHMINLDYPGLQLIYKSKATGAPIFIIPNFLSENECEKCLAKVSGQLTLSSTTAGLIRTSAHVRPIKAETPGLHARIATLTKHPVESMETAKIMRYQVGHQFGKHTDLSADRPLNIDGSKPPPHTNREITCFVYLNSVKHGGSTAFYSEAVHLNRDGTKVVRQGKEMHGDCSDEVCSIRPERGMLVLFFPSANPPDGGALPELTLPGNQMLWPFADKSRTAFCYDDMWHRGSPAVDEKYLMSIWVWPPGVRAPNHPEERPTDGLPI